MTQSTPVAIPTGPAVVTSTIVVAGAGTAILDVDATTFIQHTFSADLDITITSPAGTVVTLTTDNGASNDNVFNGTVWDDDANPAGQVPYTTNNGLVTDHTYVNLTLASPLTPEEALAAFIGEDPNGTWTLTISDDLAGDGGSLNSWSLDIRHLHLRRRRLGRSVDHQDRRRHQRRAGRLDDLHDHRVERRPDGGEPGERDRHLPGGLHQCFLYQRRRRRRHRQHRGGHGQHQRRGAQPPRRQLGDLHRDLHDLPRRGRHPRQHRDDFERARPIPTRPTTAPPTPTPSPPPRPICR